MHHKRIARLGAFDVEGAGLWIGPLATSHSSGISAARVDGGSDDVIAGLDPQYGLMGTGKSVVEFRGL
jgi:hypothetical protein